MNAYIDAYILKTIDYQEHSKLVYFYTPEGQKSAIARGVKKLDSPLRHLIQPSTLAQFDLSKGKLPTVKDGMSLQYYPNIKQDLIKSTVLSTVNDLIYFNVSETDDHPKLFRFLKKFIHQLNKSEHSLELLMVFEMKLLAFLGYFINFKHCYVCQEADALTMEIGTGLIACKQHASSERETITENVYAPLKYYLHCDILEFKSFDVSSSELTSLAQIINAMYQSHLAFSSKSKKLLMTLL